MEFDKLKQIRNEVKKYIKGQDDFIDLSIVAFLAKEGLLVYGPPGNAKTTTLRLFATITGLKFFYYQLQRDTKSDELVGLLDFEAYKKGQLKYNLGGICNADIALLDEIVQGNSKVRSVLRQVLQERMFQGTPIPLKFFAATYNPSDDEELLPAELDRFALSCELHSNISRGIKGEDKDVMGILKCNEFEDPIASATPVNIDFDKIMKEVQRVEIESEVLKVLAWLIIDLQHDSKKEIGDRILKKMKRILKANAYYHGRTAVNENDIDIINHMIKHRNPDLDNRVITKYIGIAKDFISYKNAKDTRSAMNLVNSIEMKLKTLSPSNTDSLFLKKWDHVKNTFRASDPQKTSDDEDQDATKIVSIPDQIFEKFKEVRNKNANTRSEPKKIEYAKKIDQIMELDIAFDPTKIQPSKDFHENLLIKNATGNIGNGKEFSVYSDIYFGTSEKAQDGKILVKAHFKWAKRQNTTLKKRYNKCYGWLRELSKKDYKINISVGTINNGRLRKRQGRL